MASLLLRFGILASLSILCALPSAADESESDVMHAVVSGFDVARARCAPNALGGIQGADSSVYSYEIEGSSGSYVVTLNFEITHAICEVKVEEQEGELVATEIDPNPCFVGVGVGGSINLDPADPDLEEKASAIIEWLNEERHQECPELENIVLNEIAAVQLTIAQGRWWNFELVLESFNSPIVATYAQDVTSPEAPKIKFGGRACDIVEHADVERPHAISHLAKFDHWNEEDKDSNPRMTDSGPGRLTLHWTPLTDDSCDSLGENCEKVYVVSARPFHSVQKYVEPWISFLATRSLHGDIHGLNEGVLYEVIVAGVSTKLVPEGELDKDLSVEDGDFLEKKCLRHGKISHTGKCRVSDVSKFLIPSRPQPESQTVEGHAEKYVWMVLWVTLFLGFTFVVLWAVKRLTRRMQKDLDEEMAMREQEHQLRMLEHVPTLDRAQLGLPSESTTKKKKRSSRRQERSPRERSPRSPRSGSDGEKPKQTKKHRSSRRVVLDESSSSIDRESGSSRRTDRSRPTTQADRNHRSYRRPTTYPERERSRGR